MHPLPDAAAALLKKKQKAFLLLALSKDKSRNTSDSRLCCSLGMEKHPDTVLCAAANRLVSYWLVITISNGMHHDRLKFNCLNSSVINA